MLINAILTEEEDDEEDEDPYGPLPPDAVVDAAADVEAGADAVVLELLLLLPQPAIISTAASGMTAARLL